MHTIMFTKIAGRWSPQVAAVALGLALGCGSSLANDSVQSELSHVVSGAAIAMAAAKVAENHGAEDPRWTGFMTSVGISLVMEGVQIATTGRRQVRPSALDFTSNLIGAAIGIWVADRYLLMPVVRRDPEGHRVVGVALHMVF